MPDTPTPAPTKGTARFLVEVEYTKYGAESDVEVETTLHSALISGLFENTGPGYGGVAFTIDQQTITPLLLPNPDNNPASDATNPSTTSD